MGITRGERGEDGMTPFERRLADEYLKDLCAAQAYLRAEGKSRSPQQSSSQILKRPAVQAYLQKRQQALRQATGLEQERILQELWRMGCVDPARFFDENGRLLPITALDEDTRRALAGFEVTTIGSGDDAPQYISKIRMVSKVDALRLAAMILGYLAGKGETRAPLTVNIVKFGGGNGGIRSS
jgi:phage terminase small subunit